MAKKQISAPVKWHGGKFYQQKHLHANAPKGYTHRNIPYCGMANEFWNWEHEGISEAINDLNLDVTNFFRVLQEPKLLEKLQLRLGTTPFSRNEFELSAERIVLSDRDVDRAAKFFIRYRMSRQGLAKCYATPTKRTRRGMNENVSAYLSGIEGLPECAERLLRVEIDNIPALQFIVQRDHKDAFFYLDPPYLHTDEDGNPVRVSTDCYEHEMTWADHKDLLGRLAGIEGKFMLSGYPSRLYDEFAKTQGWRTVDLEIDNKASSKKVKDKKIERLWMNY